LKTNKTILVIDDDDHIRRVIEIKLKKAGYDVIMAKNGAVGLDLIKTKEPDAVITDVMMPKMDGKAVCKISNELKKERPFLTLVMTCSITVDEKLLMKDLQDTIFMEKPFSPSRLVENIDSYFGIER